MALNAEQRQAILANWCEVEWTNEVGRAVKRLAFHFDEMSEVLDLPFPDGAVAREPVVAMTTFARKSPPPFFRRRLCLLTPGDVFGEYVNQADRTCVVLGVDEKTGQCLYEYEMPNGRTYLRIDGQPVSRNRLPEKWRKFVE